MVAVAAILGAADQADAARLMARAPDLADAPSADLGPAAVRQAEPVTFGPMPAGLGFCDNQGWFGVGPGAVDVYVSGSSVGRLARPVHRALTAGYGNGGAVGAAPPLRGVPGDMPA